MLDQLMFLLAGIEAGRHPSYCRLVETRGSTPQKAGASMVVLADGSQCGTLGGGCVEAEVKRRALAASIDGGASLHTFQLDSDYGWGDGLICGGRMLVYVASTNSAEAKEYFATLLDLAQAGHGFTEVIQIQPLHEQRQPYVPQAQLWDEQGQLRATLNGQRVDIKGLAREELRTLDERPRPYLASGLSFLPSLERCRLIIVGGGHVGQEVAQWADRLDFEVTVVDDRADYVTQERFPNARHRLHGPITELLAQLTVDRQTYCLIVTRGHNHDEQALQAVVDRGARYIGMIGSRRKIRLIFEDLVAEGVARTSLEEVHAPVGIDIGSQTVSEIAVSICAELVSHRNRGGVVPGRPAFVGWFASDD